VTLCLEPDSILTASSHFLNNTQGALYTNANLGGQAVYAAAYLLQASPGTLCPFYDGKSFTSNTGVLYTIRCGYQGKVGGGYPYASALSTTSVRNYMSCINACDAAGITSCGHVNFQYRTAAEPAIGDTAQSTYGMCTFISGYATPSGGPAAGGTAARYAMAIKATAASTVGGMSSGYFHGC